LAQADAASSGRSSRNCTGSTLATDPSAPCADDVLRDPNGILPRVVVAPAIPTTAVVPVVPVVPAKGFTAPSPVMAPAPAKGATAR
jgi:hypothetical protein